MAYSNNIPQPTDRIKASQNDILQNFISISTLIGIDHVNFDAASGNQGKHNVVSMPNFVGGAASPVAVADEIKLFAKYLKISKNYFEFGSGGSTLYAIQNNIKNIILYN